MNVIIGTAGHIDHGKTTLIRALTGRNTDNLKEEITRGISINLGFTYFDLKSGKQAGIIDVPGHEKFIKNMLVGAHGIDIVLLTIAANEGVKPQTVEHVDILEFLNIKGRIIVLTKASLVDDIMLEFVTDDVRESLKNTAFAGATIIPVDSVTGLGLDILKDAIDDMAADMEKLGNSENAPARLTVDRVFSMTGFGTVVTGTLNEGTIRPGDTLMVYPSGKAAKIRGVRVHQKEVEKATSGQRTALNVSGIKATDIFRGDVIAAAQTLTNSRFLDVKITLVHHTKIVVKMWDRFRVYLGAKEVLARAVPLDFVQLKGGESGFCQFRMEQEVAVKKDDRFVIRTFSPMETIGGGIVINPMAARHGKADTGAVSALLIMEESTANNDKDAQTAQFIKDNAEKGVAAKDICSFASFDEGACADILARLIDSETVIIAGANYFHADTLDNFRQKCAQILEDYHRKFPLRTGLLKEELKSKTTKLKQKEYDDFLCILDKEKVIQIDGSFVCLRGFSPTYTKRQAQIKDEINETLINNGFAPPPIADYTENFSKEYMTVFESMAGVDLLKLDDKTAIHKTFYDKARQMLRDISKENGEVTLAQFRDGIGTSRKYAMLLLEHFDKAGLTMRFGDIRKVKVEKENKKENKK